MHDSNDVHVLHIHSQVNQTHWALKGSFTGQVNQTHWALKGSNTGQVNQFTHWALKGSNTMLQLSFTCIYINLTTYMSLDDTLQQFVNPCGKCSASALSSLLYFV